MPRMSATDPFSPEARDPFYVPDRTTEAVSFAAAGLVGLPVPIALAVLPLQPANLVIILAMSLIAILFLRRGVAARQNRLSRVQQVDELRASVLRNNGDAP